eukprot:10163897-Lingulodinium_polyedra.AAC.1
MGGRTFGRIWPIGCVGKRCAGGAVAGAREIGGALGAMGAGACCKVILTFALGLNRSCGIGLDGVVIAPMTRGG